MWLRSMARRRSASTASVHAVAAGASRPASTVTKWRRCRRRPSGCRSTRARPPSQVSGSRGRPPGRRARRRRRVRSSTTAPAARRRRSACGAGAAARALEDARPLRPGRLRAQVGRSRRTRSSPARQLGGQRLLHGLQPRLALLRRRARALALLLELALEALLVDGRSAPPRRSRGSSRAAGRRCRRGGRPPRRGSAARPPLEPPRSPPARRAPWATVSRNFSSSRRTMATEASRVAAELRVGRAHHLGDHGQQPVQEGPSSPGRMP